MNTEQRFERAHARALMCTDSKCRSLMLSSFTRSEDSSEHSKEQVIASMNRGLGVGFEESICSADFDLVDFVLHFAIPVKEPTLGYMRGSVYHFVKTNTLQMITLAGTSVSICLVPRPTNEQMIAFLADLDFAFPTKRINLKKFAGL